MIYNKLLTDIYGLCLKVTLTTEMDLAKESKSESMRRGGMKKSSHFDCHLVFTHDPLLRQKAHGHFIKKVLLVVILDLQMIINSNPFLQYATRST